MKITAILLVLAALCGCTSQLEKDVSHIDWVARQIGILARDQTVVSESIEIRPGYPQSNSFWKPTFSNSTAYLSWILEDQKITNGPPYADASENPFCVVLDLPIYVRYRKPPEGGPPERIRENDLIGMPFLFTRNLEIDAKNGTNVYSLTTNWPFGKQGVAIYTYYGEHIFLKPHEIQSYFEAISFDHKILRP